MAQRIKIRTGQRPVVLQSITAVLLLLLKIHNTAAKEEEAAPSCNAVDSQALKQFRSDFSFGGQEAFETWREGSDCCRGWAGVRCNRTGRVESLTIASSRDIIATDRRPRFSMIGASLSNLTYLEELSLVNIDYNGGSIPPGWGRSLRNSLRVLRLEGCNLGGRIPAELCNLTRLQSLVLKGNRLDGVVPDCFFFSGSSASGHDQDNNGWMMMMKNLTLLDLTNNRLRGRVPSIPCHPSTTCKFLDRRRGKRSQ